MATDTDGGGDAALDTKLDLTIIAGAEDSTGGADGAQGGDGGDGGGAPGDDASGQNGDAADAGAAAGDNKAGAVDKPGDKPGETKRKPWFEDRIDTLTRKLREAERKLEGQGRSEGDAAAATAGDKEPRVYTEAEVQTMVEERAAQTAQAAGLQKACNDLFDKGLETHKDDFVQARDAFAQAFGEEVAARPDFLEALTELPNGHEVFFALGKDLDQAAELLKLPPTKMGLRLSQLSNDLGKTKEKPISGAPAPVTPVKGSVHAERDITDPDLDMKEFVRRRNAQDSRFH